jgi:hypothetical protein
MGKLIPFEIHFPLREWLHEQINNSLETAKKIGTPEDDEDEVTAERLIEAAGYLQRAEVYENVLDHIEPDYAELMKGNIEV